MRNVCDGLTSDLEVASKFSRQSEGSVLGVVVGGSEWIFHIAVNALFVPVMLLVPTGLPQIMSQIMPVESGPGFSPTCMHLSPDMQSSL